MLQLLEQNLATKYGVSPGGAEIAEAIRARDIAEVRNVIGSFTGVALRGRSIAAILKQHGAQ